MSPEYSKAKGIEEHILPLPNDRQLAYAHNGPTSSRTVIIFFTGLFSVGTAPNVPSPCRDIDAHWISPTLPGMGKSSIRADMKEPYNVALLRDMNALLSHLYPTGDFDALYVGGGSYGTVQAQMLYGAPYDLFPSGRKIKGCVLLAGFSPFKYHANYAKSLSWHSWVSVGPPSQLIPFHGLQRLFSTVVASKFKTIEGTTSFLKQTLFDKMDAKERAMYDDWLKKKGLAEMEHIETMAESTVRCCVRWDGFREVSDVVHSNWGFNPAELDNDHASKPVIVVESEGDGVGSTTSHWMVENYKSAKLKLIPGGHISSLFFLDEIYEEIIAAGQRGKWEEQ